MYYTVAVFNESNFYERENVDTRENPVDFSNYNEAVEFAKHYVEQGYEVIISKNSVEDKSKEND